ncbi:MAG: hypothetical protein R6X29_05110 [Acidimicrobiia bacterium]|jgi:hypothetical protein
MTGDRIVIRGGADEYAAAALAAVVHAVRSAEEAARAVPRRPTEPTAWVKAGRWVTPDGHPSTEVRPDPGRNWPR